MRRPLQSVVAAKEVSFCPLIILACDMRGQPKGQDREFDWQESQERFELKKAFGRRKRASPVDQRSCQKQFLHTTEGQVCLTKPKKAEEPETAIEAIKEAIDSIPEIASTFFSFIVGIVIV